MEERAESDTGAVAPPAKRSRNEPPPPDEPPPQVQPPPQGTVSTLVRHGRFGYLWGIVGRAIHE